MTVTAKPIINPVQVAVAQTTQYTTPAGIRTIIDKFTATNPTGAPSTITVNLVASGNAAGATNVITSAKTLAPGEVYTFPEIVGHVLNPGDFISTAATTLALNLRASGREIS